MRHALVGSSLLAVILFAAPLVRADKAHECVDAYERSQIERKGGHLVVAHEQLLVCAQDSCPAVIKKDCVPWLAEVVESLPSVVVFAKDPTGKDLTDVKVSVDGAPFSTTIDGVARPVDPGRHVFRFEEKSGQVKEETVVIGEGQKRRAISVTFEGQKVVAPAKEEPTSAPAPDKPSKAPAYGLGALGLAGIGAAIFFGVSAKSDADDLRTRCAPRCTDDDIGKVETKLLLSDIGLGVGIVALGVAAWMFLRSPSASGASAGPGVLRGSF
jgi:hypothetical protein